MMIYPRPARLDVGVHQPPFPSAINAFSWTSRHQAEFFTGRKLKIGGRTDLLVDEAGNSCSAGKSSTEFKVASKLSIRGGRFMRLNSVTVDKEVDLVTPPSHESGLNCPTPPEVDLLGWHRLALCCIYLRYLLLHCTLYGVQSQ